MNTFFSFTTILAAILAVGSIEDCGGACAGQENWLMFTIMVAIMLVIWYNDYINTKQRTINYDKSITKMRNTRRRN